MILLYRMGQNEVQGAIQVFTVNWKQQNHLNIYHGLICASFITHTTVINFSSKLGVWRAAGNGAL
jgi:hypothetical protein